MNNKFKQKEEKVLRPHKLKLKLKNKHRNKLLPNNNKLNNRLLLKLKNRLL
jgi:hypothetical protein